MILVQMKSGAPRRWVRVGRERKFKEKENASATWESGRVEAADCQAAQGDSGETFGCHF